MTEYYLLTFESTHAAIQTEKLLKPAEVTIMPVPRFISASCGISVRIRPDMRDEAEAVFHEGSRLRDDEYSYYHVQVSDRDKNDVTCIRLDPI